MTRLILTLFALASAPVVAQETLRLDVPRVLHSAIVQVKGPDGTPAEYRYTTTYDPVSGEYTRVVTDETTGEEIQRLTVQNAMFAPTREESAFAEALILNDPELAGLIARAEHPVEVSGGFPLVREATAPFCALGSRCAQYDILERVPGQKVARRIRYVVVDLRTGELVSRDLNPALESNLANPAFRSASRSQSLRFPHDEE